MITSDNFQGSLSHFIKSTRTPGGRLSCIDIIVYVSVLLLCPVAGQECECPTTQCPDGWIVFRGSCYFLSDNISVDWTEAVHHCTLHKGHLVSIESVEENSFLIDQYKRMYRTEGLKIGQEFWIGASDEMIEGVWSWYTNDRSLSTIYSAWYPGQPANDGVDEDCAVIAYRPDAVLWHDAPCNAKHHPICEIR